MNKLAEYMESGILELYALGQTTPEETREVEQMCMLHEDVRTEIESIRAALDAYAMSTPAGPPVTVKPLVFAAIDYIERIEAGEKPAHPPVLHDGSTVEEYMEWLSREDLQLTQPLENLHARIISNTPEVFTAIVWIKEFAPAEMHTDTYEKFLIVEGTCEIIIGDTVHEMRPGSTMTIPLHAEHRVKVTSSIPCKIILQRVAA